MKIYLDVSCLNRPFDDQSQVRIRLESEAVTLVLERIDLGIWEHTSSEMASLEVEAIRDSERKARVQALLQGAGMMVKLTKSVFDRAAVLERLGFKAADAVHVAAAESGTADVLLSCDDRFCRIAERCRARLLVAVANPLIWLKEVEHGTNA